MFQPDDLVTITPADRSPLMDALRDQRGRVIEVKPTRLSKAGKPLPALSCTHLVAFAETLGMSSAWFTPGELTASAAPGDR